MSSSWPMVPLGEVATPVERPEAPIPGKAYRQIGVRLWGEGAYEREQLDGGETRYRVLNRVDAGDIVVNKIWARNGSVAVVPQSLAGCFGSNEFPTFSPDQTKLDPNWILWLTKTKGFWQQCDEKSQGTSGKNRIRPERFLQILIALPPVEEQRRIVAKIDALAAKIADAKKLRDETGVETSALMNSALRSVFGTLDECARLRVGEICTTVIDCLHSNPVYADEGIPTVRSPDVGLGLIYLATARKTGEAEFARRTARGIPQPGDIVIVREGGGTGKAGIVEPGQRFSLGQRVMMLRPNPAMVEPAFLLFQWLSPLILEDQIVGRVKGSASPHLNIGAAKLFEVRLPPLEHQRRIVGYVDDLRTKANKLREEQGRTAAELDAMLPAILDRAFSGEL
jgi:type I restriction enzyme S subunit